MPVFGMAWPIYRKKRKTRLSVAQAGEKAMLEKLDVEYVVNGETCLVDDKKLKVAYMDEFQVMDALLLSADKILAERWNLGAVGLLLNAYQCIKEMRELLETGETPEEVQEVKE